MFEDENGLGRERRPEEEEIPEKEESFLERFQPVEESEQEEDVEALIGQVAHALQRGGREEMDLLWSSFEPRDERLWKRRGNTIRSITTREGHYTEHVELGVCELGEDFRESLEALRRRSILQVACLPVLGSSASRSSKVHFLEKSGGAESWRVEFEAAVRDLLSGEAPDRLVLILAEMGEGAVFCTLGEGREAIRILLDREDEDLVLRLPPDLVPRETRIELPEGPVQGASEDPAGSLWRFRLAAGMSWEVVLYRPLVLEFTSFVCDEVGIKHLWPSVSVVEFMEVVTRKAISGEEGRDSR